MNGAKLIKGSIDAEDLEQAVKYQVVTQMLFKGYSLDSKTVDAICAVAISGERDVSEHSANIVSKGIRNSPQSARNLIGKLLSKGLLKRDRAIGGLVSVGDALNIVISGKMMINYTVKYVS